MIGKKIQDAFNKQINAEIYSAYLYKSMAVHFAREGLHGSAGWMNAQVGEEWTHAEKFIAHIIERGGKVKLAAIDAPPADWKGPAEIFKAALEHEKKVTAMIDKLVQFAADEGDNAAGVFLQWFVSEQVEEEASVEEVIQALKRVGDSGPALMMLDAKLGKRGQK